jgi:hypothetical protein
MSERIMKNMSTSLAVDDLKPEYTFDYSKVRPNRFAKRVTEDSVIVVLDPDVAQVFTSAESVNTVLRALIETMPDDTIPAQITEVVSAIKHYGSNR